MAWYNILLGKLQVHQHPMMELSSKWLSMGVTLPSWEHPTISRSNFHCTSWRKHFSRWRHNHSVVHGAGVGPTTRQHGTHNAKVNNQLQAHWVKRLSHKPWGLSSDLHIKPDRVAHVCNLNTPAEEWEVATEDSPELINMVYAMVKNNEILSHIRERESWGQTPEVVPSLRTCSARPHSCTFYLWNFGARKQSMVLRVSVQKLRILLSLAGTFRISNLPRS